MWSHSTKPLIALALIILVAAQACSSSSGEPSQPTIAPSATFPVEATEAPSETAAPTPQAVGNIQDVKKAVVQIEAQGTFIDPQVGLVVNGAGRGSGFIIDPEGIAVTNNHVVTGAALLKVWVAGDSEPRNARVLGVSECSDLAVIDIEGDGYSYLDWYPGEIEVGTDVYVAGFPLGDPEYTLNKGVISKSRANGETSWASVDAVIEYDATSNPGNSGGPVVDPDGRVLGVHYASDKEHGQAFGISKQYARDIVDTLRSGQDMNAIGVNGQAVGTEDGSLTGIWVSSVKSGSPADEVGLEAGDIITKLESLVLATDGTMSQYCDILRSHQPGDTLSLEVLRWANNEVLEGQLNGHPLELAYTLEGEADVNQVSGGPNVNLDASQSGDIYYSTEFDAGLDDWVYFLTNGEEDNFTAQTINDRMRVQIDAQNTWVYFVFDQYDFDNVRIDTTAENLGRNNNNVSLICRESPAGWYEFNIANNGTYTILWFDEVNENDYILLYSGGSTEIKMGKDVNEYTAICDGDQLTLGINGVEVRTVEDNNLKSGRVGFSVSSFNVTPITVAFDHFVASVP
jgi:S1-C subfamily serine protease